MTYIALVNTWASAYKISACFLCVPVGSLIQPLGLYSFTSFLTEWKSDLALEREREREGGVQPQNLDTLQGRGSSLLLFDIQCTVRNIQRKIQVALSAQLFRPLFLAGHDYEASQKSNTF